MCAENAGNDEYQSGKYSFGKKCEKITNFEIFLVYWKQF